MKIAVCVKRVPDTEARIKVGADGASIDESGVKFVLNPYDEFAVEEALCLKERAGAGEVAVVSVGGDASQETIRTALAMGADRGILLKVDRVPLDPLPVARALADAQLLERGVSEVMQPPFPVVDATLPIEGLNTLLSHETQAALVRRDGRLVGIVTRYDVLRHVAKIR